MNIAAIRKKLVEYVQTADSKKIRAIYTMVEGDIDSDLSNMDPTFLEELDKRSISFENRQMKSYTWEETKNAAIESLKLKKKNLSFSKSPNPTTSFTY